MSAEGGSGEPGVSLDEFSLIDFIARHTGVPLEGLRIGIGDDAAVLQPPPGRDLALCTDTLIESVHFFPDDPPESIGHRALAVNLSDLAAMGAQPAWSLLALTLPRAEASWLEGFVQGYAALSRRHGVALLGGDLCRGPLTITVQAGGWLPRGQALSRGGARPGEGIFVSGTLGEAAAAVALIEAGKTPPSALLERLRRPQPRVALGQALLGVASACIDLSDGLLADLGHLLEASGAGARLEPEALPLPAELLEQAGREAALGYALTGGDDYELCFTLPAGVDPAPLAAAGEVPLTRIGTVTREAGIVLPEPLRHLAEARPGYRHF